MENETKKQKRNARNEGEKENKEGPLNGRPQKVWCDEKVNRGLIYEPSSSNNNNNNNRNETKN